MGLGLLSWMGGSECALADQLIECFDEPCVFGCIQRIRMRLRERFAIIVIISA